jgi:hypothetical protein
MKRVLVFLLICVPLNACGQAAAPTLMPTPTPIPTYTPFPTYFGANSDSQTYRHVRSAASYSCALADSRRSPGQNRVPTYQG